MSFKALISFFVCCVCISGVHLSSRPEERIIGGVDATEGQVPWQVSIHNADAQKPICGGVIIANEWILTAAHCIFRTPPSLLTVRYNSLSHNDSGTVVGVSQVLTHENFNDREINSDIGLLRTAIPLTLGQTNAAAVTLPAQGTDIDPGTVVTLSGWGAMNTTHPETPQTLQIVSKPTILRSTCEAAYLAVHYYISWNMFCAGATGEGDSWSGDFGGPVTTQIGGNAVLVGLTSWRIGCHDCPDVYVRVGNFVDWIRAKGVPVQ